jgi:hypothetical protein
MNLNTAVSTESTNFLRAFGWKGLSRILEVRKLEFTTAGREVHDTMFHI